MADNDDVDMSLVLTVARCQSLLLNKRHRFSLCALIERGL